MSTGHSAAPAPPWTRVGALDAEAELSLSPGPPTVRGHKNSPSPAQRSWSKITQKRGYFRPLIPRK
jgi:hypothetical protein